ncbi:hypothetical protein CKN60_04870 [Carnobacterium divergens]|uniref:Uncharacterized protein n=2 Tax=Carnobacterium divergens TaxID=2748 RepID=A0A7Z8D0D6_CARDV|nr:hypothetical protein CKN58_04830 [Carnobacterium divergens]TFI77864.1 hypothetical protein CKN85_04825 [Carnobacterium divergens]TFI84705.1 hypothetical protein CKN56_04800 [Carnobacterium divergens]TFI96744.1 hypothetical protein CKN64_04800 [Carnobacterium divergens]TFJ12691.1 hypothetical protein CKN60_04870 [Carnobacterium divergens]
MSTSNIIKHFLLYDVYIFISYVLTKIVFKEFYTEFPKNNIFFSLFFGMLFTSIFCIATNKLNPIRVKLTPVLLLVYFSFLLYNSFFRADEFLNKPLQLTEWIIEALFFIPLGGFFYRGKFVPTFVKMLFLTVIMLVGWVLQFKFSTLQSFFLILLARLLGMVIGFISTKLISFITKPTI